uniref:Putative secreted protein n=1 Tax=Anopheles darlingi TaxID=43151 RepID=A0A2M4D8C4_ANODA
MPPRFSASTTSSSGVGFVCASWTTSARWFTPTKSCAECATSMLRFNSFGAPFILLTPSPPYTTLIRVRTPAHQHRE